MENIYYTISDLMTLFKQSRWTIYRWMRRKTNPFPAQKKRGGRALWLVSEVEAWEEREDERQEELAAKGE